MNPYNRSNFAGGLDDRKPVGSVPKSPFDCHLKVAALHVDMLHDLPAFRELTTEELFRLIPRSHRKFIPPVGDDLGIREAAYERETRMRRAVIIGILAKPEQIAHHQAQQFTERL